MKILGIESSCDETAAAIVEDGSNLLSNVVASSQQMHSKYGGIIPDVAAREQLKSIIPVIDEALSKLKNGHNDIDAIAVTVGPGLIGSLLVGVEAAKTLSLVWNKPLVPINHLVGHIYANWITKASDDLQLALNGNQPTLPAIILLVSGGHSEIILMTDHGKFEILGTTKDDAAGECFDKCGRLIALPYPYGPFIQSEAQKRESDERKFIFPRPMLDSGDLNFSFSGLKTAFLNETKKIPPQDLKQLAPYLASELQDAIVDVLVKKTLKAVIKHKPLSLILAGGVAANKQLRSVLQQKLFELDNKIGFYCPPISLCTDNASYIAASAFYNYKPLNISQIDATPDLNF